MTSVSMVSILTCTMNASEFCECEYTVTALHFRGRHWPEGPLTRMPPATAATASPTSCDVACDRRSFEKRYVATLIQSSLKLTGVRPHDSNGRPRGCVRMAQTDGHEQYPSTCLASVLDGHERFPSEHRSLPVLRQTRQGILLTYPGETAVSALRCESELW